MGPGRILAALHGRSSVHAAHKSVPHGPCATCSPAPCLAAAIWAARPLWGPGPQHSHAPQQRAAAHSRLSGCRRHLAIAARCVGVWLPAGLRRLLALKKCACMHGCRAAQRLVQVPHGSAAAAYIWMCVGEASGSRTPPPPSLPCLFDRFPLLPFATLAACSRPSKQDWYTLWTAHLASGACCRSPSPALLPSLHHTLLLHHARARVVTICLSPQSYLRPQPGHQH